MADPSINQQANSLLRTYMLAFHCEGTALADLIDAGVPHSSIGSLYPYDYQDWVNGYDRLTLDRIENPTLRTRVRRPRVLNPSAWKIMIGLGRRLAMASPYFDYEQENFFKRRMRSGNAPSSPAVQLAFLVVMLHVLAALPDPERQLENVYTRSYANQVLDTARSLTKDPRFQPQE